MEQNLLGLVSVFIAMAIMLGIGTIILGSAVTDCTGLTGYDKDNPTTASTGWAKQCLSNNTNAQSGYGLMMITLIVLAAVVILVVIRHLN